LTKVSASLIIPQLGKAGQMSNLFVKDLTEVDHCYISKTLFSKK